MHLYRTSFFQSLFMHRAKIHDYRRISVDRKAVITSFGRNAHHCQQLFAIRSIYLRAMVYMKKDIRVDGLGLSKPGIQKSSSTLIRRWTNESCVPPPLAQRLCKINTCEFPDIEVSLSPILSELWILILYAMYALADKRNACFRTVLFASILPAIGYGDRVLFFVHDIKD